MHCTRVFKECIPFFTRMSYNPCLRCVYLWVLTLSRKKNSGLRIAGCVTKSCRNVLQDSVYLLAKSTTYQTLVPVPNCACPNFLLCARVCSDSFRASMKHRAFIFFAEWILNMSNSDLICVCVLSELKMRNVLYSLLDLHLLNLAAFCTADNNFIYSSPFVCLRQT